jgi:mannose-6-phosphate isomerase-like protein (cupin superfamily)
MSALLTPRRVLDPAALERFAASLARSAMGRCDLRDVPGSARSYELIWADAHVNAWIIRWSDDADTGFHDHDGSSAGIVVLEGAVVEERLALDGPPITRRFRAGESFHMPASAIHRIRHGGGAPAVTVHAYSPPLTVQGVYVEDEQGALERRTAAHTEELRGETRAARA